MSSSPPQARIRHTNIEDSDFAGTIPDGLQLQESNAELSLEATRMPKGPETDAAEQSDWSEFFDSREDIEVSKRAGTFRYPVPPDPLK